MSNNGSFSTHDPKVIGIISYFWLLGWVVAVVLNQHKDPYASFHIRQSLGIHLLGALAGFVIGIPVAGWLAGIVGGILAFALWIIGFINSIQGEQQPVPVLGESFQEWFKNL